MSEIQMDQSGNYCMAHIRKQSYTVMWEGVWCSVLIDNSQTWEEEMYLEKQPRILLFGSHQE